MRAWNGRSASSIQLCLGIAALLLMVTGVHAHSPIMDADLSDWCVGAFSNTAPGGGRVEDSSATLTCGNCSSTTDQACQVNTDCPGGETCVNLTSKVELVWWDNRTDGAVNDLGTVVTTQDSTNLYFAAELWVDPDPVSLPFGEIAIDFQPGGIPGWHDPFGAMVTPGNCSVSTDRACTSDEDCHFCMLSTEPFPSTRVRACGSACDPDIGDMCDTSQTCLNLGAGGLVSGAGQDSSPATAPDYMLVFDFSRWLIGLDDSAQLLKDVGGSWTPVGTFAPAVNPGASGGSGGPPGSVEVAVPWSAFGCTGCPDACSCPDFGPGQDFRYSMVVARGTSTLDYTPDGAVEDVVSEAVGGTTTTSQDDCPGMGIVTTNCELADNSADGFVPGPTAAPGGRSDNLLVGKSGGDVSLNWGASCSVLDDDYSIYAGTIGSYYSHAEVPGFCTTAGATSATFTPGVGSEYYIVVPHNGSTEGSYGEDSDLLERPAAGVACNTQSLGNCP